MKNLTYEIIENGAAIHCLACNNVSTDPDDVLFCHCKVCHSFHDVPDPVALLDDQYLFLTALRDNHLIPKNALHFDSKWTLDSLVDRRLITHKGPGAEVTVRGKKAMREHLHVV